MTFLCSVVIMTLLFSLFLVNTLSQTSTADSITSSSLDYCRSVLQRYTKKDATMFLACDAIPLFSYAYEQGDLSLITTLLEVFWKKIDRSNITTVEAFFHVWETFNRLFANKNIAWYDRIFEKKKLTHSEKIYRIFEKDFQKNKRTQQEKQNKVEGVAAANKAIHLHWKFLAKLHSFWSKEGGSSQTKRLKRNLKWFIKKKYGALIPKNESKKQIDLLFSKHAHIDTSELQSTYKNTPTRTALYKISTDWRRKIESISDPDERRRAWIRIHQKMLKLSYQVWKEALQKRDQRNTRASSQWVWDYMWFKMSQYSWWATRESVAENMSVVKEYFAPVFKELFHQIRLEKWSKIPAYDRRNLFSNSMESLRDAFSKKGIDMDDYEAYEAFSHYFFSLIDKDFADQYIAIWEKRFDSFKAWNEPSRQYPWFSLYTHFSLWKTSKNELTSSGHEFSHAYDMFVSWLTRPLTYMQFYNHGKKNLIVWEYFANLWEIICLKVIKDLYGEAVFKECLKSHLVTILEKVLVVYNQLDFQLQLYDDPTLSEVEDAQKLFLKIRKNYLANDEDVFNPDMAKLNSCLSHTYLFESPWYQPNHADWRLYGLLTLLQHIDDDGHIDFDTIISLFTRMVKWSYTMDDIKRESWLPTWDKEFKNTIDNLIQKIHLILGMKSKDVS